LKNNIANRIENAISPFAKSAVSVAVVSSSPKKYILGAIAAPETPVARTIR
jgi:hypothetical protein